MAEAGGGKYDGETQLLMAKLNARGVMVLVIGGNKGNGFSLSIDSRYVGMIAPALRSAADEIEENAKKMGAQEQ